MTEPTRPHSRGLPVRNVRLDDERWTRITAEAARTQTTASDVIRAALDAHLAPLDRATNLAAVNTHGRPAYQPDGITPTDEERNRP